MKTVGIIGAMESEVSLLRSRLDIIMAKQVAGMDFYMGKLAGKNVVVVRCRVGKVNAAICAQILIDMYGVDCIVNTGAAGALADVLNIGDVVVSSDLVHHDFDTTGVEDPPYMNTSIDNSFFRADEKLVNAAKNACAAVLKNGRAHTGRIASGDQFIMSHEIKARIYNDLGAMCVEMEGAAIGQTCYLNNVPFVVIRAISDKADNSAHMDFEQFVIQAASGSAMVVEAMLHGLQ
ncbi:MAG: 5'-methylthioadenosine/adenosylhomocysteine nucleosidase [Defluviitaleaceae bacterium]|nr:5'-methylthioadenosine/adenosylhomocysteine nucleosidase [Defluviitaleaceae bacterium]